MKSKEKGLASRLLPCCLLISLLGAVSGCSLFDKSSEVSRTKHARSSSHAESRKEVKKEPEFETGTVTGLQTITVLRVESGPKSVELMPGGSRLFVNDLYAHKNFIFDADNYGVLKVIPLPDEPVEADFSKDGRFAWVSLYNSSKVLVVDTEAGAVAGEVTTGSIPKEVAVSPDGKWVYVANWNSNTVTVIDAKLRARVKDIPMAGTPRGMCFSPEGDFAYVCIMGGSTLTEVNVGAGHVVSRQIPCGSNPRHVLTNREGNILYISNNAPGTVTLVDRAAGAVIATIKVGRQARTIALTPDERYLFVCNYGEETVGCVDLLARAQIFKVPTSQPIGMVVSARGDRLFVSNYTPPQVTVMRIVRQ